MTETAMVGAYDHRIAALSICLSLLGAFAALNLAERTKGAHGKARLAWLIGGGLASGFGTWTMHYTAMLAFQLPVPVSYHWPTVLASSLPAFASAAVALLLVGRRLRLGAALAGSILVGFGIAGLHYTGMAAMRFQGMHHYSTPLVLLSLLAPMLLSFIPLQPPFLFRQGVSRPRLRRVASVLLLGSANPSLHFIGMAATSFMGSDASPDFTATVSVTALSGGGILGLTTMVLVVALLTTLVDRVRQSRESLRALAARLQSIREEEQARIARDLHDDLGQQLTALRIELWALEQAASVIDPDNHHGALDRAVAAAAIVDELLALVQRITLELRPSALDQLGLVPALRQEVRRFEERTGIRTETQLPEPMPQFSSDAATALFRICREALTNVSRHAGAGKVVVRLDVSPDQIVLRVEDDGRGFAAGSTRSPRSLGLLGMVERARSLGGEVRFQRARERGTAVIASIPREGNAGPGHQGGNG
jgi:signal transduction histidine kinase